MLLERMPGAGKLLTLEARLMIQPVVPQVVEKAGVLRAEQGQAACTSAGDRIGGPGQRGFDRPAALRAVTKGHGWFAIRELWLAESSALGAYREAEYGWPGLKFAGVMRWRKCRLARRSEPQAWEGQEV